MAHAAGRARPTERKRRNDGEADAKVAANETFVPAVRRYETETGGAPIEAREQGRHGGTAVWLRLIFTQLLKRMRRSDGGDGDEGDGLGVAGGRAVVAGVVRTIA